MHYRELVILANSRKHSGHCIAGIDINTGEWVRPINNPPRYRKDPSAFLDADLEFLFGDPFGPQLLDHVRIGFSAKEPKKHQPENEVIDGEKWHYVGKTPFKILEHFTSKHQCPWMSESSGPTDRIHESEMEAKPVGSSLVLLHLNNAMNEPEIYLKGNIERKYRLRFFHEDLRFDLSLTDNSFHNFKQHYSDEELLKDFYIAVGIGELFLEQKAYFKLVVGFFPSIGDE